MAQASGRRLIVLLITVLVIFSVGSVSAFPSNRPYRDGDHIPLFANKLQSTYDHCDRRSYYELPFCPPGNETKNRKKSLEEILEGDCFTNTRYELKFKVFKHGEKLCDKNLTRDEVAKFRDAVKRNYKFQMSYNNILVWSFMGKVDNTSDSSPKYYLVKHINFYVYYISSQVNGIKVSGDWNSAVDITEDVGTKINFTYSVFWNNTKVPGSDFKTIMDKNGWPTKEKGKEFTSYLICFGFVCILGVFLCAVIGLLLCITRYWIKNGYMGLRQIHEHEEASEEQILQEALGRQTHEESLHLRHTPVEGSGQQQPDLRQIQPPSSGQNHVGGCRSPPYTSLLAAILVNGVEQFLLVGTVFKLTYTGIGNPCNWHSLHDPLLWLYYLTSTVSGWMGMSFNLRYTDRTGWKGYALLTASLYSLPSFLTVAFVKIVYALAKGHPLLSGLDGINFLKGKVVPHVLSSSGGLVYCFWHDCGLTAPKQRMPRGVVPQQCWYISTLFQLLVGCFVPFAILLVFVDMDVIYASLWSKRVCGAFQTMFIACKILLVSTVLEGLVFTYIQLRKHHQQWQWISVFRGGSTAILMFAYGIYFYPRTDTDKWEQLMDMGFNACFFYSCFLTLGTLGYLTSSALVWWWNPESRENLL